MQLINLILFILEDILLYFEWHYLLIRELLLQIQYFSKTKMELQFLMRSEMRNIKVRSSVGLINLKLPVCRFLFNEKIVLP